MTMKFAYLACAVWSVSAALACDCAPVSVTEARNGAEIVFRGTITEISGGNVVFRVHRVWKGNIGPTFRMPEISEGAACLGFLPKLLKVGNDLLVYARRLHRSSNDDEYFTSTCTRTSLSSDADEDFSRLGKGKPPGSTPIR